MNRRAKGNKNENRSLALLNELGYFGITSRASASPIDIIAVRCKQTPEQKSRCLDILAGCPSAILIQSKTNYTINKSDVQALQILVGAFDIDYCIIQIWNWKSYQRLPQITDITTKGDSQ